MMARSPSDTAYRRLHRSGWTIGDTAFARPPGVAWCVYGRNGENEIRAEGRTRDETWAVAVEQAVGSPGVGRLDNGRGYERPQMGSTRP